MGGLIAYPDCMYATAVVDGKVVRFKLSPALARAHRENSGKNLGEQEAVALVEAKRRVVTPGEFLKVAEVGRLVSKLAREQRS